MSRAVPIALAAVLAASSCYRPLQPRSGPPSSEERTEEASSLTTTYEPPPVSEEARQEAERLRKLGPTYTPYDAGPRLIWNTAAQKALVDGLSPVIERQRLPIRTRALVWLLVGADGLVVDAVLQTSSSHDEYDRAAVEVARNLTFIPATRGGRTVPVWVIREVSLLMQ